LHGYESFLIARSGEHCIKVELKPGCPGILIDGESRPKPVWLWKFAGLGCQ
jgi:hypothetical protein